MYFSYKMSSFTSCEISGAERFAFIMVVVLMSSGWVCSVSSVTEKHANPEQPPMEFPENSKDYKIFLNNSPLLQSLQYSKDNASKSEIFDLLHAPEIEQAHDLKDAKLKQTNSNTDDLLVKGINSPEKEHNANLDAEILQRLGANIEKDEVKRVEEVVDESRTGKLAAMTGAIILTLAATGYIGMILWRKALERKYGSRQMLVNEEESSDAFKHSTV